MLKISSVFLQDSCAWEVVNVTAVREESPPDNPTFVMLMFQIHMKRKHVFSTYILTLPCVFLAALTLVVFCLPPDRPDRTSLGVKQGRAHHYKNKWI